MGGTCSTAAADRPRPAQGQPEREAQTPGREQTKDRHVADCGISVRWLRSWAGTVLERLGPDATTADVCAKVIIPDTCARKCRYVDLLEERHVGSPQYFISHTWSWKFATLAETVLLRLQDSPDSFVWLDICAINQNQYVDKGELQADDINCLSTVVNKVDATLFGLDEQGKALTRVWCLFEVWHTTKAKGPSGLHILTTKMPDLYPLFQGLDVRKAQASLESDRQRILAEIGADIGHAALSLHIKESLVNSTGLEAQQALAHAAQARSSTPPASPDICAAADIAAAKACDKAAVVASAAGAHSKAKAHASASVELLLKVKGEEDRDTLNSMDTLGSALRSLGELDAAVELQQRAFKLSKKVLGPESKATLTKMDNLALTLMHCGALEEAASLSQQALDLRQRVLADPDHLDTLSSMDNHALILWRAGALEQACALQKQVLEAMARVHGAEHPNTLAVMGNHAVTLADIPDGSGLEEGAALQRRIVELRHKVLGASHPDTLTAMNNEASMLQSLGSPDDLRRSAALLEQVLQQQEEALGPEHPDLLTSLANMACTLTDLGQLERAASIERHVLQARTRVLGQEHLDTLSAMSNYACTLRDMGTLDEAVALHQKALEMRQRVLGGEHPDTQQSMESLADTVQKRDAAAQAQSQPS